MGRRLPRPEHHAASISTSVTGAHLADGAPRPKQVTPKVAVRHQATDTRSVEASGPSSLLLTIRRPTKIGTMSTSC